MKYPSYYLSNKQLKELDRGYSQTICLPMPADEPDDYLVYARDHIANVRRPLVRDAEENEVTVAVTVGGPGLTGVLGGIVHKPTSHTLTMEVVVIECVITAHEKPRGRSKRQWPGAVEVQKGVYLPKDFQPSKRGDS